MQNSQMASVTVTYRDGRAAQLENLGGRSAQLENVEYEEVDEEMMMKSSSGKSGGGMLSKLSNLVGNMALIREDLEPGLAKL